MIDETIIINKLEQLKRSSKKVMGNHLYMKQKQFEYLLNKLIEFINEHKE